MSDDPIRRRDPVVPFNDLSPAAAERLAILAEEMGEAIQVICKILRHGYESSNPLIDGPTNREALEVELGHVKNATAMMLRDGDINEALINKSAREKSVSIQRWLHHQEPL